MHIFIRIVSSVDLLSFFLDRSSIADASVANLEFKAVSNLVSKMRYEAQEKRYGQKKKSID